MTHLIQRGQTLISQENILARVDMGMAVGIVDKVKKIGAIAHLGHETNIKKEIKTFLENTLQNSELVDGIYIVTGNNPLIPNVRGIVEWMKEEYAKEGIVDHTQGRYVRTINLFPSNLYVNVNYF